jgi:hypothetical protein
MMERGMKCKQEIKFCHTECQCIEFWHIRLSNDVKTKVTLNCTGYQLISLH